MDNVVNTIYDVKAITDECVNVIFDNMFNQVSKDMQKRLHEDDKFMLEIAHALVRQTAKKLEKQFG